MQLEVIKGDITKLKVDAIVNSANPSLLGGAGVDGAIHKAAGPGLLKECIKLRKTKLKKGLKRGEVVLTKGYNLFSKFIIHTVGPVYSYNKEYECKQALYNCFYNSLSLAEKYNCKSIAFPAISCGIFDYPKKKCALILKKVLEEFKFKNLKKAIICLYDKETYIIFKKVLEIFLKKI